MSAVLIPMPFDDRESERQSALDRYAIVDTPAEQAFDDIVRLAAMLCDAPAAAISFIDHERLWFKARIGIDQPQLERAHSLCGHAIDAPHDTLVVRDLALHGSYARKRRLRGKRPRFYAGVPLLSPEGHALGVVSVGDVVPRTLTAQQLEGLRLLTRQTQHLLELRRLLNDQGRLLDERTAVARRAEDARVDLQRRHDDLEYAATHDALTGLVNRTGLDRLRAQRDAQHRLATQPYVLVVLDIDHFKQVNDRHGHLFGDRALCAVADAISRSVRSTDVAARYGGEEFLVVLPDTRLAGGAEIAERIRAQVQALALPVKVTVSVGIADGGPQDTPEAVFERADQALYRAKQAGRNRVVADDTPR